MRAAGAVATPEAGLLLGGGGSTPPPSSGGAQVLEVPKASKKIFWSKRIGAGGAR